MHDAYEPYVRALAPVKLIFLAMGGGVVVLLVGGQWVALAGPAVMLGILATLWPSRERVGAFIDAIDRDAKTGDP